MLEISTNLLSTESLREKGVFYCSDRQQLFIAYNSNVDVILADVYSYNGLPYLVIEAPVTILISSKTARKAKAIILVQYLRLGYIYLRKLVTIAKQGLIQITGSRELYCIAYLLAQAYQVYSRIPIVRPVLVYYLVSIDVVIVRYPSLTKDRYFILFTEAKALERDVFFLSYKSGATVYIQTYYIRRKNTRYLVVIYRLDRGREYRGNVLITFVTINSIRLQIIPPYISIKNRLREVSNYIVCTTARKIIIYANLLLLLQAEAVRAIVYILNLTPSDALGGDFLRYVIDTALGRSINAKKPLLNTLRAYGSTTVVYDEAVLYGAKIDARGERGQLVGYKDSMYRVQIPSKYKVKRTLYY